MADIHSYPQIRIRRDQRPTEISVSPFVLSRADRLQLERHLQFCVVSREPLLTHLLRHKLDAPESPNDKALRGTVGGGCSLSYRIGNLPVQSGLLSHRSRTGGASGVIPVLSLLGATLIGMRVNQRASLLCENGSITSVVVLDVVRPA